MSAAVKCDRCGEIGTYDDSSACIEGMTKLGRYFPATGGFQEFRFQGIWDLCDGCFKQFEQWLKTPTFVQPDLNGQIIKGGAWHTDMPWSKEDYG